MKTAYILIRLFLLVCSCAFCEARGHCGHRGQGGQAPALANAGKEIEEMGRQMKRFTDESTRHFQTMGVSMSNVLKVMSDNAARGINLMEQQVKQMTEQTNTHLEAMINTVKDIQTQFLQRVVNIEEAVDNVNTVVKKSHVGLDIGTLILLLFAFFVSRYLRLHTGNDIISLGGYIILSFIELAFLIYAFQLSANILHKRLTGEDIENETLLQLAFGTGCLIVSILVILLVVRLTVTWVLPFIVWSVKTLLVITFGWPLQRNLSIRQRVGFSILCTTVVSVFLYYSTSPVDCAIILSAFLFIAGVCVNVLACFDAPKPQATPAPSNEDNEILLLNRFCHDPNENVRKRQPYKPITLKLTRTNSF